MNAFGDTFDGKNYCVAKWTDTETEAVWDLAYHPFQDLLLSVSAADNNAILLWDCSKLQATEGESENPGHILSRFGLADSTAEASGAMEGLPEEMTPTACTRLHTQQN